MNKPEDLKDSIMNVIYDRYQFGAFIDRSSRNARRRDKEKQAEEIMQLIEAYVQEKCIEARIEELEAVLALVSHDDIAARVQYLTKQLEAHS